MRIIVPALVGIVLQGGVSVAQVPDAPVTLSLPAQLLRDALNGFARQTGLQVIYAADDVGPALRAPDLEGEFTPEQALKRLLDNTGLTYEVLNARTIVISDASTVTSPGLRGTHRVDKRGAIRLAQFESHSATRVHESARQSFTDADAREAGTQSRMSAELEEIVVTGTHIRGAEPAGAKVMVLSREAIMESGYGRLEDVLANLPQNFKGTGEEASSQLSGNVSGGAEIQLRGLGVGTTLTLVNGIRLPAGGSTGGFTDISSLPIAAIERVEILADGASALYGSDAIGGVVNIILRDDFEGGESRLRYATAGGEGNEIQISQVLGHKGASVSVMGGYQYYLRNHVPADSREYTARNRDMSAYGGTDFRQDFQFAGNPGTVIDLNTLQPYAIPAGQDGTSLQPGDFVPGRVNYTDFVNGADFLPQQELHAFFGTMSYDIDERWNVFASGRYSVRDMEALNGPLAAELLVPSSNAFFVSPFGNTDPLFVLYDFAGDVGPSTVNAATHTYAATVGVTGQITDRFQLRLTGSYGHENSRTRVVSINTSDEQTAAKLAAALADSNPTTALNVFGSGGANDPDLVRSFLSTNLFQGISDIWSVGALTDGPIAHLPGGPVRVAVGADYRGERLQSVRSPDDAGDDRSVGALFAELSVPLVGADNELTGVHRLEMSVAGRYEKYSDFGTTLDPKVGLTFMPNRWTKLRSTWGTSFRAPTFDSSSEALSSPVLVSTVDRDPQSPTGRSRVLRLHGANPDLKEETATVWSAGVDLQIPAVESLTFSVTYFDIEYQDKIESGTASLATAEVWGELITRAPLEEQTDALCGDDKYAVFGPCTGTFAAILDYRPNNIAVVATRGIDFEVSHASITRFGEWSYGIGGTYTLDYEQAITETSPVLDLLDTVDHPLALRVRGSLGWSHRGMSAGLGVRYTGSYDDPAAQRIVGSWTTLDVNVGYTFPQSSGWLHGAGLSLIATNVLDELPPFVDTVRGYDPANASLLGRLVSLQLTKSWQ